MTWPFLRLKCCRIYMVTTSVWILSTLPENGTKSKMILLYKWLTVMWWQEHCDNWQVKMSYYHLKQSSLLWQHFIKRWCICDEQSKVKSEKEKWETTHEQAWRKKRRNHTDNAMVTCFKWETKQNKVQPGYRSSRSMCVQIYNTISPLQNPLTKGGKTGKYKVMRQEGLRGRFEVDSQLAICRHSSKLKPAASRPLKCTATWTYFVKCKKGRKKKKVKKRKVKTEGNGWMARLTGSSL